MKTFKKILAAFIFLCTFFISCNDSGKFEEQIDEKESIRIDTVAPEEEPVLIDTIGVYKLNSEEARTYVIKMNRLLYEINKAIDEDDVNNKWKIAKEMKAVQSKQMAIRNTLSASDQALFKIYTGKIIERYREILTKIKNT